MAKSGRKKSRRGSSSPPGRELRPDELNARFGTIREPLKLPYPPGTLSIAMIVKNEAANIREAIAGFRAVSDEIIVHDTGSTDGTQEILESLGVNWFQGEWRDDFAWARNRSLEKARCSWILWMDADDRIPPEEVENFKKLKTAPLDRAFGFQVINTQGGLPLGSRFMQLRMFPNHPDIRFRYRVHEQLFHGLARLGLHCFYTETTIHHTGYEDPSLKLKKARRNLDLLKQESLRLKEEPALAMSVGDSHYILGEWEEGIAAYKYAMAMPNCEAINRDIYREMPCCIGRGYYHMGRRDEALPWFDKSIALEPGKLEPYFYKAECLLDMGRPADAEPLFRKLVKMPLAFSTTSNQYDVIQIYSAFYLARICHSRGDHAGGRDCLLEIHKRYAKVVETWHLLGRCQVGLGEFPAALESFDTAIAINASALPQLHRDRLDLLRRMGREDGFREALDLARKGFPGESFPDWTLPIPVVESAPIQGNLSDTSTVAKTAVPALSLCMIVKDEKAHLPVCLRSAAGLAGEIIVVDTGSTDGTQDIARSVGAKVIQTGWHGDFSLARNLSLDHARGRWILWLDADDVLLEEDKRAILRLVEGDPDLAPKAYGFMVKNSQDLGKTGSVFNQVRLFPNRPGLRFRAPVHEQILPALEDAGIPVEYMPIRVIHTGYIDGETSRRKQARNKALLEAQVASGIGITPVTYFSLASACLDLGLLQEAIPWYREAGRLAQAFGSDPHILAGVPAKIASALARQGKLLEALDALAPSLGGLAHGSVPVSGNASGFGNAPIPANPEALLVKAQVEDALGHPELARPWFESLLDLKESQTFLPVDFQILKLQALQFLGKFWNDRKQRDLAVTLLKAGLAIKEGRDFTRADLDAVYRRFGNP